MELLMVQILLRMGGDQCHTDPGRQQVRVRQVDKEVSFVQTGARYRAGFLSRCTSAIKAQAMTSWTQCDKYNKPHGRTEERKGPGRLSGNPSLCSTEAAAGRSRRGFLPCSFPRAVIAPRSHFLPRFGHMLYLAARRGSS